MIRQDTRHPDKRRRHQGRASCEVAGRRFEAALHPNVSGENLPAHRQTYLQ